MKIMKNLGIKVSQTEMPDKGFNDSFYSPYKYMLKINRHCLILLPPPKFFFTPLNPLQGFLLKCCINDQPVFIILVFTLGICV